MNKPQKSDDRIIMHVDMNAFFASVEQQRDPSLKGKPVAVVGSSKRTIVTTCSYEARAFGVRTGMALWEAKRCCPELIMVVGKNREYAAISSKIMALMFDYTPLVETFSIDEAFLDISGSMSLFGTPENIACLLKSGIKEQFGLTCSIGIAPNKLLAKLASDMQKPDGLTVIPPDHVSAIMEKTPIRDLCGIGKKTEKSLAMLGIRTCGELGRFPVKILRQKFGIIGDHLHRMGLGLDDSPVVPPEESDQVKSVGHSMTLEHDVEKREEILKHLLRLAEMVGRRMRRYGVTGKTVSLSVRYADFYTNFSRQLTLPDHTNLSDEIYRGAIALLDSVELSQPVRLLGIKLANLRHQEEQLSLFSGETKKSDLARAMDQVNSRFGEFSVTYGSLLDDNERRGSSVISPAWRPSGIRKVEVD
jgi:DNA polymerase-4